MSEYTAKIGACDHGDVRDGVAEDLARGSRCGDKRVHLGLRVSEVIPFRKLNFNFSVLRNGVHSRHADGQG